MRTRDVRPSDSRDYLFVGETCKEGDFLRDLITRNTIEIGSSYAVEHKGLVYHNSAVLHYLSLLHKQAGFELLPAWEQLALNKEVRLLVIEDHQPGKWAIFRLLTGVEVF